jgi:protein pelota
MRIVHQDANTGRIKLQMETEDDLWHLYNILEVGDMVVASTYRREEKKADKIRAERTEKRRMTLGIRVEKVEFHDFDMRLRVLGTIEEGPQDIGSHHTLNVEEGEALTIVKGHWRDSQLERIRRAVADARKPQIAFVSLDQDDAVIAVQRQFGLREVATIRSLASGKQYEDRESGDYYGEVISKLEQVVVGDVPLVIVGPGFAKEVLVKRGKEDAPSVFSRVFTYHTGQSGMAGIHEMMKRGLGTEVLEQSRMAMEVKLVEDVLKEISCDGLVAYGPNEVQEAATAGAVETLLVLDSLIRERDLDPLIREVEKANGKVVVISEHHDAGRELEAITGVAALLRYRIS